MLNFAANAIGGYNLTRSLRFRASASASLSRTPASAGDRQKWTWSGWVKRGNLGSNNCFFSQGNNIFVARFNNNTDVLEVYDVTGGPYQLQLITSQVFRDPSAWYHIVIATDTTQATAANRVKIYVNGSQVTAFSTATYYSQNYNTEINTTDVMNIGALAFVGQYFDGYLTEINFINAQQLTPSSFGSYNSVSGVWQPAPYTGTYGTNGFYLPFTDNSALTTSSNVGLGRDFSGNGNYWATNNISITSGVTYDSMTDVPTLTSATAANFAVLNPLFKSTSQNNPSNGNLTITGNGGGNFYGGLASSIFAPASSGKFYWEFKAITLFTTNGYFAGGIATNNFNPALQANPGSSSAGSTSGMSFYPNYVNNELSLNGSVSALNATYAVGDVMNFALDTATGKFWIGKNNTWLSSGNPSAGTNQIGTITGGTSYAPWFGCYTSTDVWSGTFGQQPFAYTPPTGFVALNTYNLPTSTIVKGNTVMDATLYTGTLLSNAVTNAASFKPDLVWVKSRSAATDNELTDSVRGVTKSLTSNSTAAEATDVQGLTAFNTNGFTVGTNTNYNNLAATYVGWQWQAGQGSSSSNTNGTITSTVSVNASAGFSIATYTGTGVNATVGHGLGVAPSLIIVKNRTTSARFWTVYHQVLGNTQYLQLDSVNAAATSAAAWNNTSPTSSVFTIGTGNTVNSTDSYVAYCWAEIAGFSKFGSYTGNNSTDGPFIYTGFRPKFLVIKSSTYGGVDSNWNIIDTARNPSNVSTAYLNADQSAAESSYAGWDILSNGFKLRNVGGSLNNSGATYVYMAYAETPTKFALAR